MDGEVVAASGVRSTSPTRTAARDSLMATRCLLLPFPAPRASYLRVVGARVAVVVIIAVIVASLVCAALMVAVLLLPAGYCC